MILRQLTSIRCQLVSIQGGVLFGLEERQVAGNPKQKKLLDKNDNIVKTFF